MDNTSKSQKAISNLNPSLALRYSATHINPYNLVYSLGPVEAYDMKLVKQIEVVDTVGGDDYNQTLVRLDQVGYWPKNSRTPQAKVTIYEDSPNGPKEKQVKVKHGADLSVLTNRKQEYEGYLLTNINAEPDNEYLEFQNGKIVELFHEDTGLADIKLKNLLRQTIEQHFAKEKRFKGLGIKVLSLFFIDHVHHYRTYDETGNQVKGKLALWFEEIYQELSQKPQYAGLIPFLATEVHNGYFAADKNKKTGKIVEEFDTNGSTVRDDEAYHLIMQAKEELLDLDQPLRFIFSHSALKEGWDNPNVFQICTLREMGTDRERRQTIGRGLRLPVNQLGDRISDEQINRLTVIANESFESYAKGLQTDIEKSIDPSGNFRFGRITTMAFVSDSLSQEDSTNIWNDLKYAGIIDEKGNFTDKYQPDQLFFNLPVEEKYQTEKDHILNVLNEYRPRQFVKKARDRKKITYQKRIETLNPDFKIIWDKISQKTKYVIDFSSNDLIERAVDKIRNMPAINAVLIQTSKRDLKMTAAGVESGRITSNQTREYIAHDSLPDLIEFLVNQTEMTSSTIVTILKSSNRLVDFVKNPVIFMTQVANLINKAKNELIIDGIKYQPILNEKYEMRLFDNDEIEAYLDNLYKIQSQDNRTPYDYIEYDSDVEKSIAEKLDSDEQVKFFCKLPSWFVVKTPLGDYNPDWAIVVHNDNKLYLVRETKSTHNLDELRPLEKEKIKCGMKHFDALGVNYKVATNIYEVIKE